MKILVLSKRFYTNKDLVGERYGRVYKFSGALAKLGHRVHGLALDYRRNGLAEQHVEQEPGNLAWHVCNLFPNPIGGVRRYLAAVTGLVKEFSPDILLSTSDVYHVILGDRLSRRFGIIHVADLYDDYECFGAARLPGAVTLYRRALSRAAGIICVSHSLKAHIINTYKPKVTPEVITNAVDLHQFRPHDKAECRRRFSLPQGKTLIGVGGAIFNSRGIHAVVDAHRILAESDTDIHLVLAGARSADTVIPSSESIHYLGELDYDEMPMFFNALDVGIIVNRETSFSRHCFPQKFFEMLACGLPVVVAAIGDVKGMMESCPDALFQPGVGQSLATAIRKQLTASCLPDVEITTWDQQGLALSGYLEAVDRSA